MASFLKTVKKIMLGGDAYDEEEYVEDYAAEEEEEQQSDVVTDFNSLRRRKSPSYGASHLNFGGGSGSSSKVVSFQASIQMQVVLTSPQGINDATAICDYIKENKTCVVNLEGVDRVNAQRIADFLAGATYSINGEIQRISNEIFIIAPANVHISGEFKEELKASGLIFPWGSTGIFK